jgi:hypothetical protein
VSATRGTNATPGATVAARAPGVALSLVRFAGRLAATALQVEIPRLPELQRRADVVAPQTPARRWTGGAE